MTLHLQVSPAGAWFNGRKMPCSVGFGGIGEKQAEGDGITPIGEFALQSVWYRSDRIAPKCALPLHQITPLDGWSDDPRDPDYNQPIRLPHAFGHEVLYRDGPEYDLLAVMDYNRTPIRPGAGSAVFLHVWRGAARPTAGCIALSSDDLLWVLAHWQADSRVVVQP
jgi:L,D-peptidoglycan transpeptidase YkuD (ErfK/YbiS/YcfS/YnhG family)